MLLFPELPPQQRYYRRALSAAYRQCRYSHSAHHPLSPATFEGSERGQEQGHLGCTGQATPPGASAVWEPAPAQVEEGVKIADDGRQQAQARQVAPRGGADGGPERQPGIQLDIHHAA